MRYTVVWLPSAEEELAHIWNGAVDRQAVSRAADEIEVLLRTSSQARGGNDEGTDAFTIFPLAVIFEVSPDDRKVTVLEVFHLL
jgi:plasmid stabilization system protein ParE